MEGASGSVTFGNGKFLEPRGGTRCRGGNHLPLRDQKSVGRDAQRGMVMEAAPASSFEMFEPDLLLELLIIALDTPTPFGEVHQFAESDVSRQGRKPIFGRLFLTFGPFDQQPLFGPAFRACVISMRDTNPHASKARRKRLGRSLPPFNPAPGALGKAESELLDRNRFMLVVATKALRSLAAARPFLRRQRTGAGRPHRGCAARYQPHRSTRAR